MIKIGIDGTKKIYIGNNSVTTVYIGTKQVFPQNILPYDAEIEYLESRNGAYIDTQVTAKYQTNIETKLRFTGDVKQTAVPYGFYYLHKLSNRFYYRPALNSYVYTFHNATTFSSLNMRSDSLWHTIQTNVNQFIIDSLSFQSSSSSYSGTTTCKFLLFGQDVSNDGNTHSFAGTSDTSFVDIAYAKIFDDYTLIRDLIPVRVGQVGYMYDKVSGQLFGNSGSGNFVLGPDKSYGKYKFTLSDSSVITAECDNSSAITSADTSAYQNSLVQAEIGDCVTSIGDNAFSNYTNLTSITISNTVTNIGYNAFGRCTGLTSVIIPESVTTISSNAFSNCKNITSINIPSGVTSIGDFAFYGCSNFTSITVEATTPPLLGGNYTFGVTNNCPIYVPSGSVEAYKTAWNTYTDRIQAIS